MSMENSFIHRLAERLRNSRDFSISLMVHIIFVALFGGTVLFQAAQAPPRLRGRRRGGVRRSRAGRRRTARPAADHTPTQDITVTATLVNNSQVNAITTTAVSLMNFNMAQMVMAPPAPATPTAAQMAAPKPASAQTNLLANPGFERSIRTPTPLAGPLGFRKPDEPVRRGARGPVKKQLNEARETKTDPATFSVGANWNDFKKDFTIKFDNKDLAGLDKTSAAELRLS
jgi:hypothetical protein